MALSLGSAAREAGVAKSTILRMIKRGELTATRVDNGWSIEDVELRRAFQAKPSAAIGNQEAALLRAELEGVRKALAIAELALQRAYADADHWRDQAQRQLPAPAPPIVPQAPSPEAPRIVEAPALAPTTAEPERPSSGMAAVHSAAPVERQGWWRRWKRVTG